MLQMKRFLIVFAQQSPSFFIVHSFLVPFRSYIIYLRSLRSFTLVAAAGYVVHFFPTGQGNIIGNPIVPVIKLSANPRTIRTMSEHMDVDVSGILRREMNLDQAGDKLLDMMFQTIALKTGFNTAFLRFLVTIRNFTYIRLILNTVFCTKTN